MDEEARNIEEIDVGEQLRRICDSIENINLKVETIINLLNEDDEALLLEHPPKRRPPDAGLIFDPLYGTQMEQDFKRKVFDVPIGSPFKQKGSNFFK